MQTPSRDEDYMRLALSLAERAALLGEIPVGAVLVGPEGDVLAKAHNRRETSHDALAHAELLCIRAACEELGGWRLGGCTLYVTLEPCPMCAGACLQARLSRVVYGAADPKTGAAGSLCDLFAMPFPHRPLLRGGVLRDACQAVLDDFFATLRRHP